MIRDAGFPSDGPPTFNTPSGPVVGWTDGDVVRATGIPYATAGRFAPPVKAADRDLPFIATAWSPACPQAPVPFLDKVLGASLRGLPSNEHCQYLSVTLPRDVGPEEALPVMVWIHGGSYTSGAGDVAIMDPAPLVAEQRVVVVSVTYRLGLFGFLGSAKGRPANLGLLDQLEAFRWVQRNIAAFGGDPHRVTAFGQSAGGDAVAHLMATPGASSLFIRAIIQSPPLGLSRGRERMSAEMADAAEAVTLDMPAAEVVALQSDIEQQASSFRLIGAMPFGTQYGFPPLPAEDVIDAVWDSVAPDFEILIGRTAEEARLFLPTMASLQRWLKIPVLGPIIRWAVVRILTTAVYSRGIRRFAKRHAKAGGRAHTYVISWSAPGTPFGAAHTIDLPLLFGDEETWSRAALVTGVGWPELTSNGREVRQLWGEFARGEQFPDAGRIPGVLSCKRIKV